MKKLKPIALLAAALSILACPVKASADDPKPQPKAKPYILKTCIVSGDKLGEMGDPYVFVYQGREIKFCCKGCVKDFNKEPAKYVKKIEEAEKKAKGKNKNPSPATPAPAPAAS